MQSLGWFGQFGGLFAPEALLPALTELEAAYHAAQADPAFMAEFNHLLTHFAGRPTAFYHAKRLSAKYNAAIWFKREDLLHGGAHKTNNALGQALLAVRMGKTRLIAETGAGQHGVATAMAGALLGLETVVYMGATDVVRQQPNVYRMELLGTKVVAVTNGGQTLKDAINEAMRDWMTNVRDTHYVMGTVAGPHPFPTVVKGFHECIGRETREQVLAQAGRLPDAIVACVGGGSNAMGIFQAFVGDAEVQLVGVEPAGHGLETDHHGAVLAKGTVGVLHGMRSLMLQTPDGQVLNTHSVSAGLDYPSVGPEHAHLQSIGRAVYASATDAEALTAFHECACHEGILPALETSHALAHLGELSARLRAELGREPLIVVSLSGRGDKDLETVRKASAELAESPVLSNKHEALV
jgi:tryptophan synthase beta chain